MTARSLLGEVANTVRPLRLLPWLRSRPWREYGLLMRLDRPIGALLLLWPTLWALWIAAGGPPALDILVIFVLGVLLMRSAGCVINDYADRDLDPRVERTRDRPLAAARVSPREALGLFLVLILAAFALVLLLNLLTVMLSMAGAALAVTYPFIKRYTHLPQVHLGIAFGWAVPMAFAAQQGGVPPIAWLLMSAAVVWAVVYDTMYAMVDREDDILAGSKSTAILFGELDRLFVGVFQGLVLVALLLVGGQAELGGFYHAGVGAAACLSIYQQHLIRERTPADCFRAFLNNHWFGASVFAGIALDYWLA